MNWLEILNSLLNRNDEKMINNYFDYFARRWQELQVSQRSQNLPIDSQAIKEIQCGCLITVCTELQTQGHKDVGLLEKKDGNNFMMNGILIATDIMALKQVDANGVVVSQSFNTVDCIISGMSPGARPAWQVQGISNGVWVLPPVVNPPNPEPEPNPEPNPGLSEVIKLLEAIKDNTTTMVNQNEIIISRLGS